MRLSQKLSNTWRRLQRRLLPLGRVQVALPVAFHGNAYGGWCVHPDTLSPTAVVYSFGIGDDISFDMSLIDTYGLNVFGFDPTPQSINWVKASDRPSRFHFFEYGVADYDGTADFYPPENPDHISHSIFADKARSRPPVVVPVFRLQTILEKLGHAEVDVIKLDIEGAEYGVLHDLVQSKISPHQLLVEFHHRFRGVGWLQTFRSVRALNRAGYRVFSISGSGEEYSFIRV